MSIIYTIDESPNINIKSTIEFKNIGMGALIDLTVEEPKFNNMNAVYTLASDEAPEVLEKGEQYFILTTINFRLDKIKKLSSQRKSCSKQGILSFKVKYKDLLDNEYEQDIEIAIDSFFVCESGETEWLYNSQILYVSKKGELKIIKRYKC
ncbi:hypothetical protein [Clostridium beijerinckii]|uniref:hypothetical protein n=1 Tax=Clostridium beijerinckii TaxID=1520 RepID=UPI00047A38D2|nr:hypothetical protein [Clostridium beijerinckii]